MGDRNGLKAMGRHEMGDVCGGCSRSDGVVCGERDGHSLIGTRLWRA